MTIRIYIPDTDEGHLFLASWLARKIPDYEPRLVKCIAAMNGNRIGCVFGFSNMHYNRMEISMATEPGVWFFNRETCLAMLGMPFRSPALNGLTAMVYRTNKPVRHWLEWSGFKLEGNMRKITSQGRGMLMYGLLRNEYKVLIERLKGAEYRREFEQLYG